MRRFYWLTMMLLVSSLVMAQTQQGYVKTRGRMVNGQHVKGVGLPGATVQVQGRSAVLSQQNGSFSFPVTSQTFWLQSVKKLGYELVDADATRKAYKTSPNPLYLVMETPEQQMDDQLEAEEKISRTLREQLKKLRMELQQQKDANKITEEDYRQQLAQLMKDQENNKKLIADMAKEYAAIDYDQMDDLNQRISDAILNGRLTEADSLLRSKGDIVSRIAQVRNEQQAEQMREAEILCDQEALAASREGTRKKLEDIANDCYRHSELCHINYQLDSMAYYLLLRAELDTTRVLWQFEAAYRGVDLYVCKRYYDRVICLTQDNRSGNNLYLYATALYNIGTLYLSRGDSINAEIYFKKGIDGRRTYAEQSNDPIEWNHVAFSMVTLSSLYNNSNRYDDAKKYLQEATMIYDTIAPIYYNHNEFIYGRLYDQWGWHYLKTKNYEQADSCYLKAWKNYLISTNYKTPEMQTLLEMQRLLRWGLAKVYKELNCNDKTENFYIELKNLYKNNLHINPLKLEPEYASLLLSFSDYYFDNTSTCHIKESENMYKEALEIYMRFAASNPSVYESVVAKTQYKIGVVEARQDQYPEAIAAFEASLQVFRRIMKLNSHTTDVENCLHALVYLYSQVGNNTAVYKTNQELLSILKKKYEVNTDSLQSDYVEALVNQAFYALFMKKYFESEQYAREGLAIDSTKHLIATNLAAALLFQGRYTEAEQIYHQYKSELKEGFLDDFNKFAEAGVIPKKYEADVEKIKKMLNEE